ncbi:hypothetical protein BKA70DRAFT_1433608 [Coprinopsis sp. MPI-PUGE-AT-0042]|nr:hypothetical protein BKA70DRAFT_1433608 [Coprinopsis sp. MPI-PUGE-AT-0042]
MSPIVRSTERIAELTINAQCRHSHPSSTPAPQAVSLQRSATTLASIQQSSPVQPFNSTAQRQCYMHNPTAFSRAEFRSSSGTPSRKKIDKNMDAWPPSP